MTKTYCDRCGKEIVNYKCVDTDVRPSGFPGREQYSHRYQICLSCLKALEEFMKPNQPE